MRLPLIWKHSHKLKKARGNIYRLHQLWRGFAPVGTLLISVASQLSSLPSATVPPGTRGGGARLRNADGREPSTSMTELWKKISDCIRTNKTTNKHKPNPCLLSTKQIMIWSIPQLKTIAVWFWRTDLKCSLVAWDNSAVLLAGKCESRKGVTLVCKSNAARLAKDKNYRR